MESWLKFPQWQRAETLGALINGVFLVALCLSIFLEAIQRFFEPQTVSNPEFVLGVGCFGLLFNILGLCLFHEHSHSHGEGHGHSHDSNALSTAEEGQENTQTHEVADESGNVADVLPQSAVAGWPQSGNLNQVIGQYSSGSLTQRSKGFTPSDEGSSTVAPSTLNGSTSPLTPRISNFHSSHQRHRYSGSRGRISSVDEIPIHPASFRKDIIYQSRLADNDIGVEDVNEDGGEQTTTECTPLLLDTNNNGTAKSSSRSRTQDSDTLRQDQDSSQSQGRGSGHGHSHSDLNMRGVFLHVMGDALGNIGVIGSALIIWLTKFTWRFYVDPAVSLLITVVILASAIPLCKAASRILLQAVPSHVPVGEIKKYIGQLSGIDSCHELHIWQLSDIKIVASVHIKLKFDFKGEGSARYMKLAQDIKDRLHEYGIHATTIQPEFHLDSEHRHISAGTSDTEDHEDSNTGGSRSKLGSGKASKASSLRREPEGCLLQCRDVCGPSGQCCMPATGEWNVRDERGH